MSRAPCIGYPDRMQVHSLVLAALAAAGGLIAGRATRPEPAAHITVPPPPPPACIARPAIAALPEPAPETAPDPDSDSEPEADDGGEDVAVVLAHAEQRVAEARRHHNAIVGHVTDERTGEELAGVTVVVTSPALPTTQTAISDEHGDYAIWELPAGSYALMYYYGDVTIGRTGVAVSDLDVTVIADHIDPTPAPPTVRTFEGVSFSGEDTLDNTYVIEVDQ